MLCEVLESFDHFVSEAPYEGQRGIAARGEHFGRVPRTGARLIFTAADVAHVMKAVLDAPVLDAPQCARDKASNCSGPARSAVRLVMA